jgi:hypothetical protein
MVAHEQGAAGWPCKVARVYFVSVLAVEDMQGCQQLLIRKKMNNLPVSFLAVE